MNSYLRSGVICGRLGTNDGSSHGPCGKSAFQYGVEETFSDAGSFFIQLLYQIFGILPSGIAVSRTGVFLNRKKILFGKAPDITFFYINQRTDPGK